MSFNLVDYLPVLLMFIVAAGFAVTMVGLSQFVGQRKHTRTKLMPYECGKDPIGVATSLVEERNQLVGEFRVANTPDGEEALQMVRDGVFDAFSVGFEPMPGKALRNKDLVEHTEVKLREVSLVSYPAYEDAAIAGLRAFRDEK